MVTSIAKVSKTEHVREFVPSVVEPSFGIGRILYCILECNFKVRENDEKRTWLDLPPLIAPTKCSVLPLSSTADFVPYVEELSAALRKLGIPNKVCLLEKLKFSVDVLRPLIFNFIVRSSNLFVIFTPALN